jgi:AraC-like DNA-binding protein
MKQIGKSDPILSVPYMRQEEKASSPRYRWNNWERGDRPYVILQWTLSGEGRLDCDQGTLRVPEDYAFVVLVPERTAYYYSPESREPWVFGWMNFYGEFACEIFRALRSQFGAVLSLPRRSAAASSLRRLLAYVSNPRESNRWQVSLQAYAFVLEWWRQVSQPQRRSEDRLEWAIRFCRERFREPLAVKEIADQAGMSREYFSRIFAARMRETPAAFLRRLRLNEASILLRETRLPLGEIAMRSGFYSGTHLMHTFQRVRGTNPSRWRKRK